ncbi:hypothetical protein GCM10009626_11040 [Brachybacterium sacelli]
MVRFREFSPAPRTTTSNPGSTGEEGERMVEILAARPGEAAEEARPPRSGVTGPTPRTAER